MSTHGHLRQAQLFRDLRAHNERRAAIERLRDAKPENRRVDRILELNRDRIREQSRRPR